MTINQIAEHLHGEDCKRWREAGKHGPGEICTGGLPGCLNGYYTPHGVRVECSHIDPDLIPYSQLTPEQKAIYIQTAEDVAGMMESREEIKAMLPKESQ